jgi:hypothetical protein
MPPMNKDIPEFFKGERLSADHLDQIRQTLVAMVYEWEARFGPIEDQPLPAATAVEVFDDADRVGILRGQMHHAPIAPTDGTADLDAVGLGEMSSGGDDYGDAEVWDLSPLEHARLAHYVGRNADGKPILVVDAQPCVRVKVTTAASGGGKYNGRILKSSQTAVAATGTLAEADLGTVPSSDNCLVLNGAEVGKSTHDLTTGTPVAKVFVGFLIPKWSTDNKLVVVINGMDWEACT